MGFDLDAIRRKRERARIARLYTGRRELHWQQDGPVAEEVAPLTEAEPHRGAWAEMMERLLGSPPRPFQRDRYTALCDLGYHPHVPPGDLLPLLYEAAIRRDVRRKVLLQGTLRPLRNRLSELATEYVTGATWGTKAAEAEPLPEDPTPDPADIERRAWKRLLAGRALFDVEVNERTRDVAVLWLSGRSYKEIGETMGIAPGTVGTYLTHFRQALRDWAVERELIPE